jgi:iron(III) transport system ATP-binding protein
MATPSTLYREPADEVVAGFIGDGMVVPVSVRSVNGDGSCHVDFNGHGMRMRCAPGQRPGEDAKACLHAGDLRIGDGTRPGVAACIERAVYKGGYFRVEARIASSPGTLLHLEAPEPLCAHAGSAVMLDVMDGWIIPAAAA